MARTLVEARKELDEKRDALGKIFEEAGEELDFEKIALISGSTAEKAANVKKRNDELTALGKEVEALVSLEEIARGFKANEGQKRPTGGGGEKGKGNEKRKLLTLGEMFTQSKSFKEFGGKRAPDSLIEFGDDEAGEAQHATIFGKGLGSKALFDTTDYAPEVVRLPQVVPFLFKQLTIDDLIPETRTTQNSIKYMEETTATNGATAVAEGGTKPESALAFTEKTSPVRKIATVLPVTDEMFEDEPAMRGYVETRLRFFMELTREAQLLSGSGVAPNLTGILITAGIQTQAKGADPGPDAVYKAMTKIRVTGLLQADGTVWHPNDWQEIRLLRTADGIYIWGSPSEAGPERIWGLNVVQSVSLTEGTVLVGAFRASAMKFRRSEVSFAVSDQHADFFVINQLMLRVEERLALVVFRPLGFCTVTGM